MVKIAKFLALALILQLTISTFISVAQAETTKSETASKEKIEDSNSFSGGAGSIEIIPFAGKTTLKKSEPVVVNYSSITVEPIAGANSAAVILIDLIGDDDGFGYGVSDGGVLPTSNDPIANWFFDNRSSEERQDPRETFTDAEPIRQGSNWTTFPSYTHSFKPEWFSSIDSGQLILDMSGIQQFSGMCPDIPSARDTLWIDGTIAQTFYTVFQGTWGSGLLVYPLSGSILADGQLNVDLYQMLNCGFNGDAFAMDYSQMSVYGTASTPTIPKLISPANGEVVLTGQRVIDWSGNGYRYFFQVSTDDSFSNIFIQGITPEKSYIISENINPGTYYWRVRGINLAGAFSAYSNTSVFYVSVPPTANFSGKPTTGEAPLTVAFTDLSTGEVSTYLWDFGDSSSSSLQNPSHTYISQGDYTVSLSVTGQLGTNTETKIDYIDVIPGNNPPVINAIENQSVLEDANINFTVVATDSDLDALSLTSSVLPGGASFVDNGNGTGVFNWTPSFSQSGIYNIDFFASDGQSSDTEFVSITVTNIDRPPFIDSIGPKSVIGGENLHFAIVGGDLDGDFSLYILSGKPDSATFEDSIGGGVSVVSVFDWNTTVADTGVYELQAILANLPSSPKDYNNQLSSENPEIFFITVLPANQTPVIDSIGDKFVNENVNLNFIVKATDPDQTTPSMSSSALPSGATYFDNQDGTGTFDWTPNFTRAGTYPITFYATDDIQQVDSEIVILTVINVVQPPTITQVGDTSIAEVQPLQLSFNVTDPENGTIVISSTTLPNGATLVDDSEGNGTFNWTPTYNQAGVYDVTFIAITDSSSATEVVQITVTNVNRPPILDSSAQSSGVDTVLLVEGVFFKDSVYAYDPDGNIPQVTLSPLPSGATFIENGIGHGVFEWTPGFDQAGEYLSLLSASDGQITVSDTILFIVSNVNRPPEIELSLTPVTVFLTEGVFFKDSVMAEDPDGTIPTMSNFPTPAGAITTDNGNGYLVFEWTPTLDQAGDYLITFYATDGEFIDSGFVLLKVGNTNQPPVLDPIGPQFVDENDFISIVVDGSDPDPNDFVSFSISAEPPGSFFFQKGAGYLDWTPTFDQAGVYSVTFYATDNDGAVDSEVVTITVTNVNRPPVLDPIGNQSVLEGEFLVFFVEGSDPDGGVSYSTSQLPAGAEFSIVEVDWEFNWVPTFDQAGIYSVTFYVTDGNQAVDSEVVQITVFNVNRPPEIEPIGTQFVNEGDTLVFPIIGTDPDGSSVSYTISPLLQGSSFTVRNDTGFFSWMPDFNQAGTYEMSFYVSDIFLKDTATVLIIVNDVNQPPVFELIEDLTLLENMLFIDSFAATDPDGTIPSMLMSQVPPGAAFFDGQNGKIIFIWKPGFDQAGIYEVILSATDGTDTTLDTIILTVEDVTPIPPVLDSIGPKSVLVDSNLSFSFGATDPDTPFPSFSASQIPAGAVFMDDTKGTASFDWTPNSSQIGQTIITFRVSDGIFVDSEIVIITVEGGNQPPVLDSIGPITGLENERLRFFSNATDPDGEIPVLTTSTLPVGASFIDADNGEGFFDWTPNFDQAGNYSVTFYATDSSLAIDSEVVTITIENLHRPPILDSIGPKFVLEGNNLNFNVTGTHPEGFTFAFFAENLPLGATFNTTGDTAIFDWTPDIDQAGIYDVTFVITDEASADFDTVTITVTDVEIILSSVPTSLSFVEDENSNAPDTLSLSLSITGDPQQAGFESTASWLSVNSFGGAIPGDWEVSVNVSGLIPGIYEEFLYISASATNSPLEIPVSLEVINIPLSIVGFGDNSGPGFPYRDILITEPSIDILFSKPINDSTIINNTSATSARGGVVGIFYGKDSNSISIIPFGQFLAADTISVTLTTGITDVNGFALDQTYELTYFTGTFVYPGECNNDGVVDERDILPIGLFWKRSGTVRQSVSEDPLFFVGNPGNFGTFGGGIWEPLRAAYADVDGSGTIDANDICGVAQNYGMRIEPLTPKNETELGEFKSALKQLSSQVIADLYSAILECEPSPGKTIIEEVLENQLKEVTEVLPEKIELYQNYPNPFNPSTTIDYFLPEQTKVEIVVYNIYGQKVRTLVSVNSQVGHNRIVWDSKDENGRQVASGIYIYNLKTNTKELSKRMLLLK